mmetsp:Transcript_8997/g.21947  ORF Transcript_8997/g.21947 Transcript_8997/m.21947 type:complete len:92 (+) Transcript_8997:79-354(+)
MGRRGCMEKLAAAGARAASLKLCVASWAESAAAARAAKHSLQLWLQSAAVAWALAADLQAQPVCSCSQAQFSVSGGRKLQLQGGTVCSCRE